MKGICLLICFILTYSCSAQTIIEWSENTNLTLDDFQSPESRVDTALKSYSLFAGTNMEISFKMTQSEFNDASHLNDCVRTTFIKEDAIISAPFQKTAMQLLALGNYNFDLTELHTRKLRKLMFERKTDDINFFHPIFDSIQNELSKENARVVRASNVGQDWPFLKGEHEKVLRQIMELSDYCKTCIPPILKSTD